jgi:hypothetical protein
VIKMSEAEREYERKRIKVSQEIDRNVKLNKV